jgi:hypothetical protein
MKDPMAVSAKRTVQKMTGVFVDNLCSHPFWRVSSILKNVPLAANPNSAMLITIKERWFH